MAQVPLPPVSLPPVSLPAAFRSIPLTHRGLHDLAAGVPENAPSAFRAAIAAGYGIELDVQLTADGQAMVFHDDTLDRVADGSGPIRAHSADALRQIHLRGSNDTIPSLPDVLALVAGQVPLLIEIKEFLASMRRTPGHLEKAVATALQGYPGPVAVMSFNPHCVAHLARLAPQVARGLTTGAYDPVKNAPIPPDVCARLRGIPDYDTTRSSFISHQASDLDRPRVADLKALGATILCWTIRSPEQAAKALTIAHNITFEGYRP